MIKRNYLTKRDYDRWLRTLQMCIETVLKQNKTVYKVVPADTPEFSTRYYIKNIPNIGDYSIAVEPYECAKHRGSNGVEYFSIYSKFSTFTDQDHKLPYQDNVNHYSGKYNFHCAYGQEENMIDAFIYALRSIFSISKNKSI